jgi:RNA polymerase sigma-70 factor (ECF subfamily)
MTPETREEIQLLLTRLGDGDRKAIEPAFAALWPVLRGFSIRALHNKADAEDATQQALAKIFEQAASFDPSRDGVGWSLAIVSYECRTLRRKAQRRREQPLSGISVPPFSGPTPEALVLDRDLEAAAREVLGGLKDQDVETIVAALEECRPASSTAFRKRLQRALGRLRSAWRAKHEGL